MCFLNDVVRCALHQLVPLHVLARRDRVAEPLFVGAQTLPMYRRFRIRVGKTRDRLSDFERVLERRSRNVGRRA